MDVAAAGLVQEFVVADVVERHPVVGEAIDVSAYSLLISTPGTTAYTTTRENGPWRTQSAKSMSGLARSMTAPVVLRQFSNRWPMPGLIWPSSSRVEDAGAGKGCRFPGRHHDRQGRKAAAAAGFEKATDITGLRVEGPNKPGDAHRVARILGDAGITLRGLSASVIGKKYVLILGFDSAADADKATRLLRSAGK